MDLASRLRTIVRGSKPAADGPAARVNGGLRELTYEPDIGGYETTVDPTRVGELLGGRPVHTRFGECLAIDRRYEADRRHGTVPIGDCELADGNGLTLLDPSLSGASADRTVFIDLETTGLSGGAGTVAFLVGCGWFDLGAFQVRQFLLTSFAAERALLAAVADFFSDADLIVSYNGKTFDVPVMETRWSFHRLAMPLDGVPHFDMLHPARRLWSGRTLSGTLTPRTHYDDGGCRLSTLERVLFDVSRVGDVPGFEIPTRFFRFLRSGDPRPLEPVLEHNRLDLVSLAAVTAHAAKLAVDGAEACRDCAEALALGRVYERAGRLEHAETCYRRAVLSDRSDVRAEAIYRLGLRYRRTHRFPEAAECWQRLLQLTEPGVVRRDNTLRTLRAFAVEALAIHNEHRARNLSAAKELAMFALEEAADNAPRADGIRHRLARLDRKIAKRTNDQLFS